ncbi:MAG: glycosyltransferase family 9 protein [Ignavibacteriae bacterium]|nr:glycosyltransferase family 9 protein [Ignavibacteriota bacterium]
MTQKTKILVVQIGKIGDMILTTPLFCELKRLYPDSEISVLASTKNSAITKKLSTVDLTIEYNKKLFSTLKLIASFRRKSFDLWVDTKDEYSSTSKLLKSLCGPKKSLGFNFDKNVFDVDLKNFVVGEHRVDINLSPINYLSNEKKLRSVKPNVDIPAQDTLNVSKRLEKVAGKKILLNLSAGINTRDWATQKWIEVSDAIDSGCNVILTGQEKDYESINLIISKSVRDKIYFIETNSIFELAELIKQCDLIVTPDTSAVHLASCFNTPIVSFFHNVDWVHRKFAPLSEKQIIIVSKEENSFSSITVSEVINAINSIKL